MVLPFIFSLILLPFPPGRKEVVSKWLCGPEVAIWDLTLTDDDHNPLSPGSIYHTDHLSSLYFISLSVSRSWETVWKAFLE